MLAHCSRKITNTDWNSTKSPEFSLPAINMAIEPSSSSSDAPTSFPKVIVVGAGIAGITAAKELRRKGWPSDKVVLLEASADIGGRMRTERHRLGFSYDAGAAYVHGTIGNPIAAIAEEAGILLKQVSTGNPWMEGTASVALFSRGERATEEETWEADELFHTLRRRVSSRADGCDDPNVRVSDAMAEILREEPFSSLSAVKMARLRFRMASMALWHGGDLHDLQLLEFGTGNDGSSTGLERCGDYPGPHCVVDGGVRRIIDALATDEVTECLRLGCRVESVTVLDAIEEDCVGAYSNLGARLPRAGKEQQSTGVFVTVRKAENASGEGETEVLHGDAVVVTAPLSILKQGSITFDPSLRQESKQAMSRLCTGNYEKIIAEFAQPFWPADAPCIGCCPVQPTPPVGCTSPPNGSSERSKTPSDACSRVSTEPQDSDALALPINPILVENYLWSKGVPVLTAAVSGERGRQVAKAVEAAAAAGAAEDQAEDQAGGGADEEHGGNRRGACARELYDELMMPALRDAFGSIPDPVSVTVTGWAREAHIRGSYSFFPVGAREDDIYCAGIGAAMEAQAEGDEEVAHGDWGGPGSRKARVVFAGEATSVEYEGSMHGAYHSGVRAVEDIVHSYRVPDTE